MLFDLVDVYDRFQIKTIKHPSEKKKRKDLSLFDREFLNLIVIVICNVEIAVSIRG